ncbi:MAG: hypothetical protein ACRCR6_08085 [Plesiomonas sp.]
MLPSFVGYRSRRSPCVFRLSRSVLSTWLSIILAVGSAPVWSAEPTAATPPAANTALPASQEMNWPAGTPLTIELEKGRLSVIGRDDDKPTATLTINTLELTRPENDPVRQLSELPPVVQEVRILPEGKGQRVILPAPPSLDLMQVSGVHANLAVPKHFTGVLNIRGKLMDLDLHSFSGTVSASTLSGKTTARDLHGIIHLYNQLGSLQTHNLNGTLRLQQAVGDLTDTASQGNVSYKVIRGQLTVDSQAKEISIEQVDGTQKIQATQATRLSDNLQTGQATLLLPASLQQGNIQTVNAALSIQVAPEFAGTIQLNGGAGGDIVNQLTTEQAQPIHLPLPDKALTLQRGAADTKITVSTINSTITLLPAQAQAQAQ